MARITATGNMVTDLIGGYVQSKNKQKKYVVYLKDVCLKQLMDIGFY